MHTDADLELLQTQAEAGDIDAQCELGKRLVLRSRDEDDIVQADHMATAGAARAMHNLAVLEMRFGNETAAFEWFLGGAENGHSQSMHTVSAMLLEGDDPDAALDWFRKAADAGDHVTCFELAEVLYARSEPNDDRVAAGYLRDAAERGYAPAQAMLGDLYHAGRGVSQSSTLACLWFRRAAADGHPTAQARLAQAYRDGDGVEPDTMEAAHWALRAEEQGNRDAQIPLMHVAPVKRTCSVRRAGNSRHRGQHRVPPEPRA